MMKKPGAIAIEIMAGKPKDEDDAVEAHIAVCPKCGHEFEMGGDDDSDESEEEY